MAFYPCAAPPRRKIDRWRLYRTNRPTSELDSESITLPSDPSSTGPDPPGRERCRTLDRTDLGGHRHTAQRSCRARAWCLVAHRFPGCRYLSMSSRVSAGDGSIVRRTIKNRGDAERTARVVMSGGVRDRRRGGRRRSGTRVDRG